MKYRIHYLLNKFGHRVGCIAINLVPNSKKVEYQFAVHNPSDPYDPTQSMELAIGRLVDNPITLTVPKVNMNEISTAVMKSIARDPAAPSRARKSAKNWLNKYRTV